MNELLKPRFVLSAIALIGGIVLVAMGKPEAGWPLVTIGAGGQAWAIAKRRGPPGGQRNGKP